MIFIRIPGKIEILAKNMIMLISINMWLASHNHHSLSDSFLAKSGKHQSISDGISAVLIFVVVVIIRFILHLSVFFLFLLESATVFCLVNKPACRMFSLTFTPMVSFFI